MTDFGEGEFDVAPSNPAGFMAYNISIGTTATDALDEWRSLGGTATTQQWYRLYGQVTDTLLRTPDYLALDPGAIPSLSDLGTWAAGAGGEYATQVGVFTIDQETGLQSLRYYTVMSDVPLSKEEAEAQALADFGTVENQEQYGDVVQGAAALWAAQTVPWLQVA